jgi:hypothetical protein
LLLDSTQVQRYGGTLRHVADASVGRGKLTDARHRIVEKCL